LNDRSRFVQHLLFRLRNEGFINIYAVSFVLTEMHFRKFHFRVAEIVYAWIIVLFLRRDPKITIGLAQVSFSYWRSHFGEGTIRLFLGAFDPITNYKVCCDYLGRNSKNSIDEMLIAYNGRPSSLYVTTFYQNLSIVLRALRRPRATPRSLQLRRK
jgi:hypothetical protein